MKVEQVLGYSKQAIEFFEKDDDTKSIFDVGLKTSLSELLSLLDKSIKFILPERGATLEDYDVSGDLNPFRKNWIDLMLLPYPIVAFEIPFPYENITEVLPISGIINEQIESERRIALCWNPKHVDPDIDKINQLIKENEFQGSWDYIVGDTESPDGFCVAVFFYNQQKKEWCYAPSGVFLPYQLNVDNSDDFLLGRLINLFPFYIDILNRNYQYDFSGVENQMWHDINHEVWSVLQACCVLNCENISTRIINPPLRQQKSRNKKGLKPLYSYKVLTIKASGQGYENMYSIPSLSKGSKKRTHFRRGHLRRLTNKTVWVKPSIVGNKNVGEIDKSYLITK